MATEHVVNRMRYMPFTDATSPTKGIEAIFIGGFLSRLSVDPDSTIKELCDAGCNAGQVLAQHQNNTLAGDYQLFEPPVQEQQVKPPPLYEPLKRDSGDLFSPSWSAASRLPQKGDEEPAEDASAPRLSALERASLEGRRAAASRLKGDEETAEDASAPRLSTLERASLEGSMARQDAGNTTAHGAYEEELAGFEMAELNVITEVTDFDDAMCCACKR